MGCSRDGVQHRDGVSPRVGTESPRTQVPCPARPLPPPHAPVPYLGLSPQVQFFKFCEGQI